MFRRIPLLGIALVCALLSATNAQFTCTLTNTDEDSCLQAVGDDNDHCVWCTLAGFGFCLGEQQAEQMEQNLPNIQCDRYSPSTDDAAPKDDDAAPNTDDTTPPSDDSLPDDFWTCLQKADSKACLAADCTWCDSNKFGFGLCMTGPTAESAADSDFFTCTNSSTFTLTTTQPNHVDTTCVTAYLQDPTQEGCTSSKDSQGLDCEWCSIAGMTNICLTQDQADITSPLGVSCLEEEEHKASSLMLRGVVVPQEPVSSAIITTTNNGLDNSCLEAFAKAGGNMNPEDCTAATDNDGVPCEFCSIPGITDSLCVTEAQAKLASNMGIQCGGGATTTTTTDLELPPNFLECLEEYQEGDCNAARAGCSWCTSSVGIGFCLAEAAARALAECNFFSCDRADSMDFVKSQFPLDPICLAAGMGSDDAETDCNGTMDSEGAAPCIWCNAAGVYGLCMSSEGAAMAHDYLDCDMGMVAPE